jgi:hypothetical protein
MSVGLLVSSLLIGVIVEAWNCFHRVSVEVTERCRLAQEADHCLLRIAEDLREWNKRPWVERARTENQPVCADQVLVIPGPSGALVQYSRAMDDPDDLESAHLVRDRYLSGSLQDSERIGAYVQKIDLSWSDPARTLATLSLSMASSYRLPSRPNAKALEITSRLLLVMP